MSLRIQRAYHLHRQGAERALAYLPARTAELQEQLTTGKRINRASDDAADFAQVRRLAHAQEKLTQFSRNLQQARLWLDHGLETLSTVTDLLSDIYEMGIQGATDSTSQEDRSLIAKRIRALKDELLTLANTQFEDQYLFAGTRTRTAPFEQQADGTIVYHGNEEAPVRQIAENQTLPISPTGKEVFFNGDTSLFDRLDALISALESGSTEDINRETAAISSERDRVLSIIARQGAYAERASKAEERLASVEIFLAQSRSALEDVDMVQALTEFQRNQLAYQSALKATASLLQTSLVDFL